MTLIKAVPVFVVLVPVLVILFRNIAINEKFHARDYSINLHLTQSVAQKQELALCKVQDGRQVEKGMIDKWFPSGIHNCK